MSGSNTLEFSFYMPEHKVNPGISKDSYSYPSGIKDNDKQRYKPCLVEDIANYDGKPTYVIINGLFTDHQNHTQQISYKVYLGEDNWQDFNITRNCQYNNYITILGTTNSKDALEGSVSVDHRVTISRKDFSVSMERETMLDSHFEVRPIRIQLYSEGEVEVKIADNCDWIRLEKKNSGENATYCTNGKRKYFTDDLVTNTLKNNTSCKITSNNDNCVWLYIDENNSILGDNPTDEEIAERKKSVRTAEITVTFTPKDSQKETTVTTYLFNQRYLYPVKSDTRKTATGNPYIYYIEFFEEYLHNFDSDDNHGQTNYEGMQWGLDGLPISNRFQAAYVNDENNSLLLRILDRLGIDITGMINSTIGKESPRYDFYLTRDQEEKNLKNIQIRDYAGYVFTQEIYNIANSNNKLSQGTLDAQPLSAVEYCYNKNKKNEDLHWYLPSIDEMEDIVKNAYTEFDVFQDKYYWSSQPSYLYHDFTVSLSVWFFNGSTSGVYYNDDLNYARSTKILYNNGQYTPAKSGINGSQGTQPYTWKDQDNITKGKYTQASTTPVRDEGNKLRTDMCRVRAVYRP